MLMLGLILALLTLVPLPDQTAIRATDLTTGQVVACATGHSMTLVFTHSMYGGDVEEVFVAHPEHGIVRVEMTTANAAAAEYYAYTATVTTVGDRYRVDVPPARFDEVTVRVGDTGRQRLRIDGREVDLLAMTGDGHRVRLERIERSILARIAGDSCAPPRPFGGTVA